MYPSDLTVGEWNKIKHFFKRPDPRGSKGKHTKREIVNAILYVVRGGISWRMLPKDMPPWKTVYDHFRKLNQRGVWKKVVFCVNKHARKKARKKVMPTYGIVDSKSCKTAYSGSDRGIDGGKKNKGTKTTHLYRFSG